MGGFWNAVLGQAPVSSRGAAAAKPEASPPSRPSPPAPLNKSRNPEEEKAEVSFARNKQWAKPGPYITKLSPHEESQFQRWGKDNHISTEDMSDAPNSGYDMRGYWRALINPKDSYHHLTGKGANGHYNDRWKTPYSGVFSGESMYALPKGPYWRGDNLYTPDGRLIVSGEQTKAEGGRTAPARTVAPAATTNAR